MYKINLLDAYLILLIQRLEMSNSFTEQARVLCSFTSLLCKIGIEKACDWTKVLAENEIFFIGLDTLTRTYLYEISEGYMTYPDEEFIKEYAYWRSKLEEIKAKAILELSKLVGGRVKLLGHSGKGENT